jgi:hypothetical protein
MQPVNGKMYRLRKDTSLGAWSGKVVHVMHQSPLTLMLVAVPMWGAHVLHEVPESYMDNARLLVNTSHVNKDGVDHWFLTGTYGRILHNMNGPALAYREEIYWYVYGTEINSQAEFMEASGISYDDMMVLVLKYGPITSGWRDI